MHLHWFESDKELLFSDHPFLEKHLGNNLDLDGIGHHEFFKVTSSFSVTFPAMLRQEKEEH
jgi:hypothetical protein